MIVERIMIVEAVLDGKLSADILTQQDIEAYTYLTEEKQFIFAIDDAFERNPSLTFGSMESKYLN